MKRLRFSEEQAIGMLKEHQARMRRANRWPANRIGPPRGAAIPACRSTPTGRRQLPTRYTPGGRIVASNGTTSHRASRCRMVLSRHSTDRGEMNASRCIAFAATVMPARSLRNGGPTTICAGPTPVSMDSLQTKIGAVQEEPLREKG